MRQTRCVSRDSARALRPWDLFNSGHSLEDVEFRRAADKAYFLVEQADDPEHIKRVLVCGIVHALNHIYDISHVVDDEDYRAFSSFAENFIREAYNEIVERRDYELFRCSVY